MRGKPVASGGGPWATWGCLAAPRPQFPSCPVRGHTGFPRGCPEMLSSSPPASLHQRAQSPQTPGGAGHPQFPQVSPSHHGASLQVSALTGMGLPGPCWQGAPPLSVRAGGGGVPVSSPGPRPLVPTIFRARVLVKVTCSVRRCPSRGPEFRRGRIHEMALQPQGPRTLQVTAGRVPSLAGAASRDVEWKTLVVPTPVTLHETWHSYAHSLTYPSPNPHFPRLQLGKLRPREGE